MLKLSKGIHSFHFPSFDLKHSFHFPIMVAHTTRLLGNCGTKGTNHILHNLSVTASNKMLVTALVFACWTSCKWTSCLTRLRDQRILWHYRQEPIKRSHHSAKFVCHRHSYNRDTNDFCHVTLQDHVVKVLYGFMIKSLTRYITILASLVAIDTVSGDIMVLVCHAVL